MLFCLGVSAVGMKEEECRRLTFEPTVSVARTLAKLNPTMTFIYVSGAGTDSTERGRLMWARVKAGQKTRCGRDHAWLRLRRYTRQTIKFETFGSMDSFPCGCYRKTLLKRDGKAFYFERDTDMYNPKSWAKSTGLACLAAGC